MISLPPNSGPYLLYGDDDFIATVYADSEGVLSILGRAPQELDWPDRSRHAVWENQLRRARKELEHALEYDPKARAPSCPYPKQIV